GFPIHAWDADLFSAIYFGAFGIQRVSAAQIDIRVRTPRTRDFATRLLLPGGTGGTLSNHSGVLSWNPDHFPRASQPTPAVKVIDERPAAQDEMFIGVRVLKQSNAGDLSWSVQFPTDCPAC